MPRDADNTDLADTSKPPDRLIFLTTVIVGSTFVIIVFASDLLGRQLRWDRWVLATGIALICGGTLSRVAVGLKFPAIGQNVTLGGTFAIAFLLMTYVPPPGGNIGRANIQVISDLQDLKIRTGHTPIYVRRTSDRMAEFLVTSEEVSSPDWEIVMRVQDGATIHEQGIYCLPNNLLSLIYKSSTAINFTIEFVEFSNPSGSTDKIPKIRLSSDPAHFGSSDVKASCGTSLTSTSVRPRTPSPDPAAPLSNIPPQTNPTAASTTGLTDGLRSPNLDRRLNAIDALGQQIEASPSAIVGMLRSWRVDTSSFDEDVGQVSSWLGPLRSTQQDSAVSNKILDSLTPPQASFLVALIASNDRSTRLAAREAVGWLLRSQGNKDALNKLLSPIANSLKGNTAAISSMAIKSHSEPQPRRYYLYNLIDVQVDAWCGFSETQKKKMLQTIEEVHPSDYGDQTAKKIDDLRQRTCSL